MSILTAEYCYEDDIRIKQEEAKTEGKAEILYQLVTDGLLTAEIAASRLGISLEEFETKLQEYTFE